MKKKLKKIGIEENLQYECITTTINNTEKNAGAFAFTYLGEDKVFCRIFEGSKTLKNIQETKKYVVNVTQDPIVFTKCTFDKLSDDYYTSDENIAILKNTPAYMIIEVESIEENTLDDFPIKSDAKLFMITGKIKELIINENTQAFNRSFAAVIESLTNYSRYLIVDAEKRKEYLARLNENQRLVNKVGSSDAKKAMEILKKEYEKA